MARPVAKDHDEKSSAILRTAASFFAENGYDRSSVSQLAQACGISKALIYHYYPSKEAILFAILSRHLSQVRGALMQSAPGQSPEQDLRALVHALLDCYRGADAVHRLQLEAMGSLPPAQQAELAQLQREIIGIFANALQRVDPDRFETGSDDLTPVTMSLLGMLNWFFLWHRSGRGITRAAYADLATDLILGGIAGKPRRA